MSSRRRGVETTAAFSDMDRFVVISGCSGGGKSTLLGELARRGHAVVEEPGRRIVRDELERSGTALPWVDGVAFARRAIEMALADRAARAAMPAGCSSIEA
jgi:predicted ATPase